MVFLSVSIVSAADGLFTILSAHNVQETASRLESILKERGMTVFIKIDHAEGAKKVGKELRPTQLVIFGNPKIGTSLMLCQQSVAIDLPQKALIWKDEAGQTCLSYNNPKYLESRHDLKDCSEVTDKIGTALANFTKMATMP